MTKITRLLALMLALTLIFALTATVYAEAHTITIKNPDAAEAHEYTAYQVFAGEYDEATGVLSNVTWGSGVDADALLADLQSAYTAFSGCTTAGQVAKALSLYVTDENDVRSIAAIIDRHVTTPAATGTATAENPAVLTVDGDGYYYVKDTTPVLNIDTYSDYILLVEGDVTVAAKDTTGVISEKKVKDINDSTGEGSGWQDSADYDVGDPVPFQLSGTVAADYDKYDSYKLIFHDKESAGLSFSHITGVFVDGVEIDTGWELIVNPEDGCTFEVVFANLKTIEGVTGGSIISVEYISILNESAVIGVPGNPDMMRMEYSNNPTDETSTGFTPWDEVVVFTYEVIVDKVDENGQKLPGAEFVLEKWIKDDSYEEGGYWQIVPGYTETGDENGLGRVLSVNGKPARYYTAPDGRLFVKIKDRPSSDIPETDLYLLVTDLDRIDQFLDEMSIGIDYYYINANGEMVKNSTNFGYTVKNVERSATDGATFVWQGVDDGHYRITETVTPPGYNTIEPIEFDIIAEHDEESPEPGLISVIGVPFYPTPENMGILHGEIENHSGTVLPETGGIGTVLFYVLGGLLLIGAGVALVVRRRTEQ